MIKILGGVYKNIDKNNENINLFLNSYNINKYLFNYELKVVFAYIKILYLNNYLNFSEKKKMINSLFIIKKKFKISYIKNIYSYLEEELYKYNGRIINRIFLKKISLEKDIAITKLMLIEEIDKINILLIFIRKSIIFIAEKEYNSIFTYISELNISQNITLGYYLLSWNEMLKRDHLMLLKCKKELNFSPINYNFKNFKNRNIFKNILNFKNLTENYIDTIKDKDYLLSFSYFCNNLITHLSNICEDLILWNNIEFNFLKLSNSNNFIFFEKNIELYELVKSKSGRIYGNSLNILTILKSKSILYSKENQEDKECLLDNIFTIKNTLNYFRKYLFSIKFNKKNMYFSSIKHFSSFFNLIEYLTSKGVGLNSSYSIINNCIIYCKKKKINFFNITLNELKNFSNLFEKDIFYVISIENSINNKNDYGLMSLKQTLNSIQRAKFFLNNIILKI